MTLHPFPKVWSVCLIPSSHDFNDRTLIGQEPVDVTTSPLHVERTCTAGCPTWIERYKFSALGGRGCWKGDTYNRTRMSMSRRPTGSQASTNAAGCGAPSGDMEPPRAEVGPALPASAGQYSPWQQNHQTSPRHHMEQRLRSHPVILSKADLWGLANCI